MSWTIIWVMVAGAYGSKVFGVLVLDRARLRTLPGLATVAALIPAALFAALVVVQTVESHGSVTIDARLAGVAVAGIAVWRRVPFIGVVVLAMAGTALLRWQTLL